MTIDALDPNDTRAIDATAPTLSPARLAMLAVLDDIVGLTADPAWDYVDEYLDYLAAPGDPPEMRRAELDASSCALTALGTMRRLGIDHPLLARPYVLGKAVAWVEQIARDKGAWMPPSTVPQPGDIVIVASPEHVATVYAAHVMPDGSLRVESVEGGERYLLVPGDTHNHEAIVRRVRRFAGGVDHPLPGEALPTTALVRGIVGVIDCDLLSA